MLPKEQYGDEELELKIDHSTGIAIKTVNIDLLK